MLCLLPASTVLALMRAHSNHTPVQATNAVRQELRFSTQGLVWISTGAERGRAAPHKRYRRRSELPCRYWAVNAPVPHNALPPRRAQQSCRPAPCHFCKPLHHSLPACNGCRRKRVQRALPIHRCGHHQTHGCQRIRALLGPAAGRHGRPQGWHQAGRSGRACTAPRPRGLWQHPAVVLRTWAAAAAGEGHPCRQRAAAAVPMHGEQPSEPPVLAVRPSAPSTFWGCLP